MALDDFMPLPHDGVPPIEGAPARGLFALRHMVAADEVSALVPHANNIVILSWIDLVASRHGDDAGASRAALASDGRMWFVARHEVDYLGEAFVGDDVAIATWIEELGRTSLIRATRIVRVADGRPLVRARSRWALVDLATRRPTPIDPAVRAALQPVMAKGKTPFDQ